MKFCASYKIPQAMWGSLDEIRFSAKALAQAINILENNKTQKVIIEVLALDEKLTLEKITDLLKEYSNLYFDFYDMTDFLNACNSNRSKSRFMYHYPANTFNMLYFLSQLPVSDITIGEPLVFNLKFVKAQMDKQKRKINIRVNPVIGRPDLFNQISEKDNGFKHFWILPQYVKLYDEYIDVLDLYDENAVREEALVRVFTKGVYTRELKYFLRNCDTVVRGFFIDEDFVNRRMNCNQVCMQDRCHWCQAYENLYLALKDKQDHDNSENPFENL